MQDEFFNAPPEALARRRVNRRFVLLGAICLLALAGLGAWAAIRTGWLVIPGGASTQQALAPPLPTSPASLAPPVADVAQTALAVRMAELEQRMARLNLAAEAASGSAARAEGLLVAVAARRAIERGAPLGYLEDQLKLRFGNTQPNAVATLIEVSRAPVTADALEATLMSLAPQLSGSPRETDMITRVREELSTLFVIRHAEAPSPAPERRLERARVFLETGRPEAAIAEVERMPGRAAARDWLTMAQRYVRGQRALDLIETAAILEPRDVNDAGGQPIGQLGAASAER